MKLVVGMIVSSDAAFLRYSLPSIRCNVDHVVIVEGADTRWIRMGNARPDGSSVDNTAEIITQEISKSGIGLAPITYVPPRVYPHRNAQRQRCLEVMAAVSAEICLLVDADEFYFPSALAAIRSSFADGAMQCAHWPFFNFYTFVRRIRDTAAMERCFRLQDGMYYPDIESGQYLIMKDGQKIWDHSKGIDGVTCFHYNKVTDGTKLLRKIRFYLERDHGLVTDGDIPDELLSEDDQAAITKNPFVGVLVPLAEQPPFSRLLPFSDIAPLTSAATFADLLGIWWPTTFAANSDQAYSETFSITTENLRPTSVFGVETPTVELEFQLRDLTAQSARPIRDILDYQHAICKLLSNVIDMSSPGVDAGLAGLND